MKKTKADNALQAAWRRYARAYERFTGAAEVFRLEGKEAEAAGATWFAERVRRALDAEIVNP